MYYNSYLSWNKEIKMCIKVFETTLYYTTKGDTENFITLTNFMFHGDGFKITVMSGAEN